MRFNIKEFETYSLYLIEGSLTVENIGHLEDTVAKGINEKKHILFDLSQVSYIDSSSIRFILYNFNAVEKNNKHFCLFNLNEEIYQMFSITELDKRLNIFDSLESALTFIGSSS